MWAIDVRILKKGTKQVYHLECFQWVVFTQRLISGVCVPIIKVPHYLRIPNLKLSDDQSMVVLSL